MRFPNPGAKQEATHAGWTRASERSTSSVSPSSPSEMTRGVSLSVKLSVQRTEETLRGMATADPTDTLSDAPTVMGAPDSSYKPPQDTATTFLLDKPYCSPHDVPPTLILTSTASLVVSHPLDRLSPKSPVDASSQSTGALLPCLPPARAPTRHLTRMTQNVDFNLFRDRVPKLPSARLPGGQVAYAAMHKPAP